MFSLRRLKPQRHFTKNTVSRHSISKFRRTDGYSSSITGNQVDDNHDADSSHPSVISTEYFGDYSHISGRAIDDIRFAMSGRVGNEHQRDNEFGGATISMMHRSLLQPSTNSTAYTSNSNFLPADSSVHCQFEPSSTCNRSMETQGLNISCPMFTKDATVITSLPYDPDAPGINSRYSSSYDCNFNSVQNFAPSHNHNAETKFPSFENQSFLPHVEPRGCSSALGHSVSMSSPNHYEKSQTTRMPILEADYTENMITNSSENVGYRGFSLPRPSLGPVAFSDSGKSNRRNEGTSYSFGLNQYPSFVFDHVHRQASEDACDQKRPQCEMNGTISDSIAMLKKDCEYSVDHPENSSLTPDICKNSGCMYSDFQKNRKSVFSRLSLAPKVHAQQNETIELDGGDIMDGSVDEVMSMLQHSQYQWLKMRKNRQLIIGDATSYKKKRKTSKSKLLEDDFQEILDEVRMEGIPSSEENVYQFTEMTSFVDFKRRSELQKNQDGNTKVGGCSGSAESEGGLHKRRKLIRPDFSKNSNSDVPQLTVETHVSSFRNIAEDGKEFSQSADIKTIPSSVSCEDNSSIAVEDLTRDSTLGGSSQGLGNTNVKESSQNVGTEAALSSVPCESKSCIAEEGLVSKDSVLNGLSPDLNNSSHSFQQDPSLEACRRSNNGIASDEIEGSRNMQASYKISDFDGEMVDNVLNKSGNPTPKSDMASEEVVAGGCKGCKTDIQHVDNENGVLSSSC